MDFGKSFIEKHGYGRYPIPKQNLKMVKLVRSMGTMAQFSRSGGAIIGTYADRKIFFRLQKAFSKIGCKMVEVKL